MYDKICKTCGTRFSYFYNTGMLGCPDCYKHFEQEIVSALKKVQGATFHVGKEPRLDKLDKELLDEYRRLIAEKELAGIEGRFDDMANLTKTIADLADELKRRRLL